MADAVTVKDFEPLLDKLLTDTQVEAHRMSRVANRNRLFDIMFRGISVVLAVAAPAQAVRLDVVGEIVATTGSAANVGDGSVKGFLEFR